MTSEGYIPVDSAHLYYREKGDGPPIIVLHGGPDFDHHYLLPDLDRLSDSFRLIYYDQRGRGKSATNVRPEDVTIKSEVADLEAVRRYFLLDTFAVLGHSWGGLLAMEYAIRYPGQLSHLILMNTAPASHDDFMLLRLDRRKNAAADVEILRTLATEEGYAEGDPDAVNRYYRVHFRSTLRRPEHMETLMANLGKGFTRDGILKARAVEHRLMEETWLRSDYDLLPQLQRLRVPTLVIHADYDLVPAACAAHVAQAIPGARFILLNECGHFSYIECPDEVRKELLDFFSA